MSMVGKLTARTVLGTRAGKLSWPYLWRSVVTARNEFMRLTMEESEDTATVRHKGQSIVQMYVRLAMEMREIAKRLESMRAGCAAQKPLAEGYGEDTRMTFNDARLEYFASSQELEETAAEPVRGNKTAPHEYFGNLTAGQLLALVGHRHEQFAKQVERIHSSSEYGVAKSAYWRVAGARDEVKKS